MAELDVTALRIVLTQVNQCLTQLGTLAEALTAIISEGQAKAPPRLPTPDEPCPHDDVDSVDAMGTRYRVCRVCGDQLEDPRPFR